MNEVTIIIETKLNVAIAGSVLSLLTAVASLTLHFTKEEFSAEDLLLTEYQAEIAGDRILQSLECGSEGEQRDTSDDAAVLCRGTVDLDDLSHAPHKNQAGLLSNAFWAALTVRLQQSGYTPLHVRAKDEGAKGAIITVLRFPST